MKVQPYSSEILSSLKINDHILSKLQQEGLPDNILKALNDIKDQNVSEEDHFLALIRSRLGEQSTLEYQSLIMNYAEAERIAEHRAKIGKLSTLDVGQMSRPANYMPDEGLVDAVNTALMLHQPLLLTGEPGVGKTQLASSVAWQLGLGDPLKFETKSTSTARDLFYTFDTLRRFQAAQAMRSELDPRRFIYFNPLGYAILRTLPWADASQYMLNMPHYETPSRSVVLIDEIDKAPRDFPNDILNELEHLYFRIPEFADKEITANPEYRPIIIMTSNSEKSLPDPFLRRCIFYHIPFPDRDRLEQIVVSRVTGLDDGQRGLLQDILEFFIRLRQDTGRPLRRKPGTAELLNWVNALKMVGLDSQQSLKTHVDLASRTLSALAKEQLDQQRVIQMFREWADGQNG